MSRRVRIQSPAEVRALQRDLDDHEPVHIIGDGRTIPTPLLILAAAWLAIGAALVGGLAWWLL